MALPGHLKAAFQHLRSQASKAQATMLRAKRSPPTKAGSAVTEPGHGADEGMDCADCASGVCDAHGTGMEELESMHGGSESPSEEAHEAPGSDMADHTSDDAMHEAKGHRAPGGLLGKKRKL